MANLSEIIQYDAGVYQVEEGDPVLGGPNGLTNVPLKNLANRTAYLKKHVDDLEAGTTVPPGIATEAFVTAEINKLDNKQSVRAGTTANITLAGTQTIDGVNLVSGDRVLVKNQTTPAENGLYVVQGAGWIRTGDADSNADVTPGLVVAVEEGTLQGDTLWKLTTNAPIAVGTTGLTFADITSGYAPLASPAFTGNPTVPTPAQFDNDTSAATTAFVQRALGSFSGFSSFAASRSLTGDDIGKFIWPNVSSQTLTLPTPASLGIPAGGAFGVFTTTSNITVAPGAGATINHVDMSAVANVQVSAAQSLTFIAVTGTTWQTVLSTAGLGRNADFGASLAANGYQKLPSGLIVQWGSIAIGSTAAGATTAATVTYPIAFPSGALAISANVSVATIGTESFTASASKSSASQALIKCRNSFGGSASTASVDWVAIGN